MTKDDPSTQVVVVVDPYSTGCLVAKEINLRGYPIVALWTKGFSEAMKTHVPQSVGTLEYLASIDEPMDAPAGDEGLKMTGDLIQQAIKDKTIHAVLAGGEAGVDLADALSEYLGLLTNGTDIKPNRRDKKIQQELIRKMGLRSVRQAGGDKLEDVETFLKTESYPVVLKPNESAGSDGVKLCYTYEEAVEHFHRLMKSQMVNGGEVPSVLCQEFLKGKEYVVDHVSRDGLHKTMMVWVYDKRPANGAAFVYYGCSAVPSDSPEAKILIPYVRGVLDALHLKNGPSHGEVIITDDGPCLVEMNCRARGGDGNWRPLCKSLNGGYSQVEATADAYLDPFQFQRLPDLPPAPFKSSGDEIILVSYSEGTVKAMPGYDMIKRLPSFHCLETGVKVGTEVARTIDLFTGIGSVILMHSDPKILQRDIDFIRYMEEFNGIFDYEPRASENLTRPHGDSIVETKSKHHRKHSSIGGPNLIRHMSIDRQFGFAPSLKKRMTTIDASKEAVIMVDPYSTGAIVALEFMNRGYHVIALWNKGLTPVMKTHVPIMAANDSGFKYFKELDEGDTLEDTVRMVTEAASPYRLVACMAGGESGVDLGDVLSEALKLRTNGTDIPNRRDKKLQQELCRKAGLRSVRQAGGAKFSDVEDFLKREPFPVVLKPTESAGSDGVKLCRSMEEAKEHFELLMQSQSVNGGQNSAVLCQEFLRGNEYIVDHVSRDGVHKTSMVWLYDKRPANGSAFVYYGCIPLDPNLPEARILISYTRRVLNAIGIKNGATHGEVIMTNDGPCLVEINCRANGGDGSWVPLARALTGGETQVSTLVDAYTDAKQFQICPEIPPTPFKSSGQEVYLVSFSKGVVKSCPGFEKIKQLESYFSMESGVQPGTFVDYTIDLISCVGIVSLIHEDPAKLKEDIDFIGDLEKNNEMFEYEGGSLLRKFDHDDSVLETTTIARSDF
ncbi:unnamed protein product [Cylindrotheca closterium]|uniref:ATP-grasp domain-containing protein n=1 Tax=Cylindrotheca closterium TaxID=2856 RepID=A0AAD2CFR1_9STRA|nr:unnamed protein product [Cylindrotheca closterium]